MSKKILLLSLVILLAGALILIGCGSNKGDNPGDQNQPGDQNNGVQKDPLDQLIQHFQDNGFTIGDKTIKVPEMIGAVGGFGIKINGQDVEFYLFDPNSADEGTLAMLEDARTNRTVTLWGISIAAEINGNLVMFNHDEHPDQDAIVGTFKSFK